MLKYNEYSTQITEAKLLPYIFLYSMSENIELNEDIAGTLNSFFKKFGLEINKEQGLTDFLKKFTGTTGKMLLAAVKKDKAEIKKLSKEISKEEFLKFLYNLDMVTLHFFTGPIHLIAAVTGWEIKIKEPKTKDTLIQTFYKSLEDIKTGIKKLFEPSKQKKLLPIVHKIEKTVPALKV